MVTKLKGGQTQSPVQQALAQTGGQQQFGPQAIQLAQLRMLLGGK